MIIVNKEQASVNEWFAACECSEKNMVGIKRIDTENAIIFIENEDYKRADEFINKKDIPQLEDAVDVLGDIDSFDIRDIDWIDANDVWDTRGLFHFHYKFGRIHSFEDNNGKYAVSHFEGRKGYPSFIEKRWE